MDKRLLSIASAAVLTGLAVAACSGGPSPLPRASGRTATTTGKTAASTTTTPTTTTPSTTTPSTAATTTTTANVTPTGPGVLADCTSAPPWTLQVEPSSIVVACADDGIGAKDLTWNSWTADTASGTGEVWENDCTPYCAAGVIKDYPASITLTDVQPSPNGPAFTMLTATYTGPEPNGHPTDTFGLERPPG